VRRARDQRREARADPSLGVVDRDRHAHQPRAVRAACCPGCGMAIRFDIHELAYDGPQVRDVMCALCGTVTSRARLVAEGFDTAA
jgi:hypothetical protein